MVLNPEFELATSDMLIQFAEKSLGIASVVKDFALQKIKEDKLFLLQFDKKIPARRFCVVTDERIPPSTAAEHMLALLSRSFLK